MSVLAGTRWRSRRLRADDFELVDEKLYALHERPRTRADCEVGENAQRPCPWVGCRHHVALEVMGGGGLRIVDKWDDGRPTCSLDIANAGGVTLDEVGNALAITRERARQIEVRALLKVRQEGVDDDG